MAPDLLRKASLGSSEILCVYSTKESDKQLGGDAANLFLQTWFKVQILFHHVVSIKRMMTRIEEYSVHLPGTFEKCLKLQNIHQKNMCYIRNCNELYVEWGKKYLTSNMPLQAPHLTENMLNKYAEITNHVIFSLGLQGSWKS